MHLRQSQTKGTQDQKMYESQEKHRPSQPTCPKKRKRASRTTFDAGNSGDPNCLYCNEKYSTSRAREIWVIGAMNVTGGHTHTVCWDEQKRH